ncbi:MAG: hypothetical protein ABFE07_06980 [Armatimonadia bacterium]
MSNAKRDWISVGNLRTLRAPGRGTAHLVYQIAEPLSKWHMTVVLEDWTDIDVVPPDCGPEYEERLKQLAEEILFGWGPA